MCHATPHCRQKEPTLFLRIHFTLRTSIFKTAKLTILLPSSKKCLSLSLTGWRGGQAVSAISPVPKKERARGRAARGRTEGDDFFFFFLYNFQLGRVAGLFQMKETVDGASAYTDPFFSPLLPRSLPLCSKTIRFSGMSMSLILFIH